MYTTYDVNLYSRSEDTTIRMHEDGDGLDMIVVKADTKFFGDIDFSMDVTDAEAFANGILKAVQWIKEKK
jgi:hypothetical protein